MNSRKALGQDGLDSKKPRGHGGVFPAAPFAVIFVTHDEGPDPFALIVPRNA